MATAEKLQDLVHRLQDDSSNLVRKEIELAKAEVREKAMSLAKAAAFGAGAAALGVLGLFALILTLIFVLDIWMPIWLAAIIVTLVVFLVAGVLGLLAAKAAKRGAPPVPNKAIAEAKAIPETLREVRS
jgi:uncharacterized membrane protein YqjE